jgi:hypothetical protein
MSVVLGTATPGGGFPVYGTLRRWRQPCESW